MSSTVKKSLIQRFVASFLRWFDTSTRVEKEDSDKVDWVRVLPFVGLHLACIGVIWVGFSWFAFWVALGLYAIRMFAITGFYHRYFSHKAFRTSRPVQFIFALIGAASVQRGPLWWAAHHRHHHIHADKPEDAHSPIHGFWRSHMGWFLTSRGFKTNTDNIKDLMKFPELRWLDRYDILVPVALAVFLFGLGYLLKYYFPELNTSGPQLLIWGFFISTVVLFHITVTINSLAHVWGTRRFNTKDDSRNNALLALLTFGEGWHNNHHHFPGAARQGFRWWEYDFTYYVLRLMSLFRLVWDLKPVPANLKRGAV
jgi:stearoyl-CoA desaturase (Delta-9 desaturase)